MNGTKANLGFFFLSLVCQILGFACAALISSLIDFSFSFEHLESAETALISFLFFHSISAFGLACWLKLPTAWKVFNLILAPAIAIYENSALPGEFIVFAALLSVLIYLPTFWTRVPYYPTSKITYKVISDIIDENKPANFIDLGCGFSSLLIYLARQHPQVQFYGVEISPLPFLIGKIRCKLSGLKNISVSPDNFWNLSFDRYDMVYAFLAPPPMERLWQKINAEMKPSSIFISNTFEVPAAADKIYEIDDRRKCRLLFFRLSLSSKVLPS